jgi:hypothetical protein
VVFNRTRVVFIPTLRVDARKSPTFSLPFTFDDSSSSDVPSTEPLGHRTPHPDRCRCCLAFILSTNNLLSCPPFLVSNNGHFRGLLTETDGNLRPTNETITLFHGFLDQARIQKKSENYVKQQSIFRLGRMHDCSSTFG